MATFVLYESAVGYALFEIKEYDEIAQSSDKVQEAIRYVFSSHVQPSGQLLVKLEFRRLGSNIVPGMAVSLNTLKPLCGIAATSPGLERL